MNFDDIFMRFLSGSNQKKMIFIITILVLGICLIILPKILTKEAGLPTSLTNTQSTLEKDAATAVMALDNVGEAEIILNYEETETNSEKKVVSAVVVLDKQFSKKTEYEIVNTLKSFLNIPAHKIVVLNKKE